jgi:hypothetical protein
VTTCRVLRNLEARLRLAIGFNLDFTVLEEELIELFGVRRCIPRMHRGSFGP